MSEEISRNIIFRYARSSKLKMHLIGFGGFILGCKIADYFFYDHENLEFVREKMEDEFWDKHGKYHLFFYFHTKSNSC